MFNKKRGFTLIELLVVIAIIGILASIVLVSFPSATKKAKDSRVVSAISQARTVMTYVYANDSSYAALTATTPADDMVPINNEVRANTNPVADLNVIRKTDNSAACMYAKLTAKDTYWYCADSTGKAGYTSTNPNTTCVAATATCPTDITG